MHNKVRGNYYDGKTSIPQGVEVSVSKRGIFFEFLERDTGMLISKIWEHTAIKKYEKQHNKLTFYAGETIPYQMLIIEDVSFLYDVEAYAIGHAYIKNTYRFFEKIGVMGYVGAILFVVAFSLGINFLILPFLARQVVRNFPLEYEKSLGDDAFNSYSQFMDIDSTKTNSIKEFTNQIDFKTAYNIEVYVVKSDVVNAFALPGGKIVVFQGILDEMDDYSELVALLGHEVGHIEKRHSLHIMIKQYSNQLIFQMISGHSHEIFQVLSGSVSQLTQLSYSREAERDADEFAMQVLRYNKVDNTGAVHLFSKLSHSHEENEMLQQLEILSTHPNTEERVQSMEENITKNGNNGLGVAHPNLEETWNRLKSE